MYGTITVIRGKKLVETSESACILNNLFHFQIKHKKQTIRTHLRFISKHHNKLGCVEKHIQAWNSSRNLDVLPYFEILTYTRRSIYV